MGYRRCALHPEGRRPAQALIVTDGFHHAVFDMTPVSWGPRAAVCDEVAREEYPYKAEELLNLTTR